MWTAETPGSFPRDGDRGEVPFPEFAAGSVLGHVRVDSLRSWKGGSGWRWSGLGFYEWGRGGGAVSMSGRKPRLRLVTDVLRLHSAVFFCVVCVLMCAWDLHEELRYDYSEGERDHVSCHLSAAAYEGSRRSC